jgi:uncharacterized membrane protein
VRGHRDLRIVAALALVCALAAPLLPVEALSLLFALPLAFFLPGYALAAATFARRPIERAQLLLLSLGLSLCLLALGALLLNYVPGGIGPVSWALLLALIVLSGCMAAALRRPRASRTVLLARPNLRLAVGGASMLIAALICASAALVLAFTTTSAKHADGYTALWLLPPAPKDKAEGGARIGVNSEEQKAVNFRLQVRVADFQGEFARSFTLEPGETRVLKLGPSEAASAGPVAVSALLFRRNKDGNVYRRVSGWLAEPKPSR